MTYSLGPGETHYFADLLAATGGSGLATVDLLTESGPAPGHGSYRPDVHTARIALAYARHRKTFGQAIVILTVLGFGAFHARD